MLGDGEGKRGRAGAVKQQGDARLTDRGGDRVGRQESGEAAQVGWREPCSCHRVRVRCK